MATRPTFSAPLTRPASTPWPVRKILEFRNEAGAVLDFEIKGRKIGPAEAARVAAVLADYFPKVEAETLRGSVAPLIGRRLTPRGWADFAHRLRAAERRLRHGERLLPFTGLRTSQWAPAQLLGALPERRAGVPGRIFTAMALAGPACCELVRLFWTEKACRLFLARKFGFSRANGRQPPRYRYRSPEELVALRCWLLLSPGPDGGKELTAGSVDWSAACRAWNREILKKRFRIDPGYNCPFGQPRSFACRDCPLGRDRCDAAVRRRSCAVRLCPECGREALFDPDWPRRCCVSCFRSFSLASSAAAS